MKEQATALMQAVGVFNLAEGRETSPGLALAVRKEQSMPKRERLASRTVSAGKEDESWEQF